VKNLTGLLCGDRIAREQLGCENAAALYYFAAAAAAAWIDDTQAARTKDVTSARYVNALIITDSR